MALRKFRRQRGPTIQNMRRHFYTTIGPDDVRQQVALETHSALRGRLVNIEDEAEKCQRQFLAEKFLWTDKPADPKETPRIELTPHRDAKRLRWGARVALFIEIGLASLLCLYGLTVFWPLSVTIGIVGALALTYMFKAAPIGWLADRERPRESYRILTRVSVIFATLAILCLVPWIFSRTVPFFGFLMFWAGGFSAIFLPLLSASLFCASELRDYSAFYSEWYEHYISERDDALNLAREIEDFMGSNGHPLDPIRPKGSPIAPTPMPVVDRDTKKLKIVEDARDERIRDALVTASQHDGGDGPGAEAASDDEE